jgi:hypothetical protein
METPWKYMRSTSLGILASCAVVALGFNLATESFYADDPPVFPEDSRAQSEFGGHAPTSPLLGRAPQELILGVDPTTQSQLDAEWVEVTDAVNMRTGSSSSNPVLKVQLEGQRLRVSSREGSWVEVIEPETEFTGWVYERYVKPVEPELKQAGLDTEG